MDAEMKAEFTRYRAEILRGLVQIAGAESTRVHAVLGQHRGPTAEERLGRLDRALPALVDTLTRLADRLDQLPEGPVPVPSGASPDRDAMIRQVDEARARLESRMPWVAVLEQNLPTGRPAPARIDQIAREIRGPLIRIVNEWFPIPKVFVAVHGIGDQFQNETVQTVAFRVCNYVGQPTALPLGRFHSPGARVGVFLPEPGRDPELDCGFAEIYWADVPRVPTAEKHTLEEPRKWARTLVQRLRLNSLAAGSVRPRDRATDERVEELLEEMIQGVTVADRIAFLASKAGLFRFSLKQILDDFLNDVQVVTEFDEYREQLLDIFSDVMHKVSEYFYASEVYIVAHSEGTVVSFMGLLMGLYERAPWAAMVRGYMTIGSPLNKHVFFWPELFDQFKADRVDPARERRPIPWRNYYDYGDPIAFDLAPTRAWLEDRGWAPYFDFKPEDDIGFARYLFPGEAHNEYWRDPGVFGHFIQEVVDPPGGPDAPILPSAARERYEVPRSRLFPAVVSYPMPYALASALLFLACYILYKAVTGYLHPDAEGSETPLETARNVFAMWGVIAGASLLARMPRLGPHWFWWVVAVVLGAGSTSLYFLFSPQERYGIQQFLGIGGSGGAPVMAGLLGAALVVSAAGLVLRDVRPAAWTLVPVILWILGLRAAFAAAPATPSTMLPAGLAVISVAWVIAIAACAVSWFFPRSGTRPLVHTGGLIIALVIAAQLIPPAGAGPDTATATGPLWPIIPAGAAFLYLWWLAIITFDLTFIWHLYIRWGGAQRLVVRRLRQSRSLTAPDRPDVPPRPIRRRTPADAFASDGQPVPEAASESLSAG